VNLEDTDILLSYYLSVKISGDSIKSKDSEEAKVDIKPNFTSVESERLPHSQHGTDN
jgi:hypothetical protein